MVVECRGCCHAMVVEDNYSHAMVVVYYCCHALVMQDRDSHGHHAVVNYLGNRLPYRTSVLFHLQNHC